MGDVIALVHQNQPRKAAKRSQRGQTTEDERTTVCCRGTSCWNCIRKLILADSIMSLWVDFAEGLWFSRLPGWYAPYKTAKLRLRKPYPRLAHWIASYPQASWWWNAHAAPRVWFHLALNLCLHSARMPMFIKRTWHQFWAPWISQSLRAPQKTARNEPLNQTLYFFFQRCFALSQPPVRIHDPACGWEHSGKEASAC